MSETRRSVGDWVKEYCPDDRMEIVGACLRSSTSAVLGLSIYDVPEVRFFNGKKGNISAPCKFTTQFLPTPFGPPMQQLVRVDINKRRVAFEAKSLRHTTHSGQIAEMDNGSLVINIAISLGARVLALLNLGGLNATGEPNNTSDVVWQITAETVAQWNRLPPAQTI